MWDCWSQSLGSWPLVWMFRWPSSQADSHNMSSALGGPAGNCTHNHSALLVSFGKATSYQAKNKTSTTHLIRTSFRMNSFHLWFETSTENFKKLLCLLVKKNPFQLGWMTAEKPENPHSHAICQMPRAGHTAEQILSTAEQAGQYKETRSNTLSSKHTGTGNVKKKKKKNYQNSMFNWLGVTFTDTLVDNEKL